ncbi:DUF1304 domain-containing protein [Acidaminobacter sp. JC074]|uniref:DUF1304 domain-containing protein n=1 Tax=Acidaminobacter sp. JC074 TaxID=2530199 RepID=UPI001F0E0B58|nr:DUF1304 domain-containing protein [Acidaminobacter sp. JC074]MCH4887413.1 DUF1304 domain-containing protein [Acidaminobacter sp. JC074]
MTTLKEIFIGIIALEHFFIMFMEMFLWEKRGPSIFKNFDKDLFSNTIPMAKNMGIYNSFLGAGLTWSIFITDPIWSVNIATFFLVCAIVAGIYATLTAEKSVFVKQSLPALIALIILHAI